MDARGVRFIVSCGRAAEARCSTGKEVYEMKIMLWCLLSATLFYPGQSTNKSTQSFRIIPIQKKETGYSNFASISFMSKNELDSFLKDTSTQIGWNNRQGFEDALRNAKLDFTKEALVLL